MHNKKKIDRDKWRKIMTISNPPLDKTASTHIFFTDGVAWPPGAENDGVDLKRVCLRNQDEDGAKT